LILTFPTVTGGTAIGEMTDSHGDHLRLKNSKGTGVGLDFDIPDGNRGDGNRRNDRFSWRPSAFEVY
jgi:hypothetical protein